MDRDHWEGQGMGASSDGHFERGLEVRREVLGAEHVNRALENTSEFSQPLQELVTAYCWGAVWRRDELDRRTRSLVNLAMLTALNRPTELQLHVRGAVNNGCSVAEIREVLLQTAIYCGVPAALESFRVAEKTLQEVGVFETAEDEDVQG